MSRISAEIHSEASEAPFAVFSELRRFIEHPAIQLQEKLTGANTLHAFADGLCIEGSEPRDKTGEATRQFVKQSALFVQRHEDGVRVTNDGAVIDADRLDRLLVANYLRDLCKVPIEHEGWWLEDVLGVLSFLSNASKRRYEHSAPEIAIAYYPTLTGQVTYGRLGRALLDDYKALLRLGNSETAIVIERHGTVIDLQSMQPGVGSGKLLPVPPRLVKLRQLTCVKDYGVRPVVFTLNRNGTCDVLACGSLVFRLVNNEWRFIDIQSVLCELFAELDGCSRKPDLIVRNLLTMAMELADQGDGALLFLCREPTDDVLGRIVVPSSSLVRRSSPSPKDELDTRSKFTHLIGSKDDLTLSQGFADIPRLLRDVCGVDGATVFTYDGLLRGFGCTVSNNTDNLEASVTTAEGSGANAAKQISHYGCSIKVSADGDATLFMDGEKRGKFY